MECALTVVGKGRVLGMVPLVAVVAETFCVVVVMVMAIVIGIMICILTILDPG